MRISPVFPCVFPACPAPLQTHLAASSAEHAWSGPYRRAGQPPFARSVKQEPLQDPTPAAHARHARQAPMRLATQLPPAYPVLEVPWAHRVAGFNAQTVWLEPSQTRLPPLYAQHVVRERSAPTTVASRVTHARRELTPGALGCPRVTHVGLVCISRRCRAHLLPPVGLVPKGHSSRARERPSCRNASFVRWARTKPCQDRPQ